MSSNLFSESVDWMLYSLSPRNAPAGSRSYPVGLNWIDARLKRNEPIREMFRRCVRIGMKGQVGGCRIEDNLAIFAFVRWTDRTRLVQASIQAIKTEDCDLETYYAEDGRTHEETYYRLDLERFVGRLFTHPYPHIHSGPGEVPRYALSGWRSENAVVDFLEHVYLQSFHARWTDWAERVWAKHWMEMNRPPQANPFRPIADAAASNQYQVLEQYRVEIATLKSLLTARKAASFDLRCDGKRCQLLGYP
jgi:hypothetical protein